MPDYKTLYEQQRAHNQEQERRIHELESKQKVLECRFHSWTHLRQQLAALNQECIAQEQRIHDILADHLPEVHHPEYSNQPFAQPDQSEDVQLQEETSGLPLPSVQYEWHAAPTFRRPPPHFLPRQGYFLQTPPSAWTSLQRSCDAAGTKDDELRLSMKFENCPSIELPSKLQIEIRDASGRVVFQKRQNIYYIKLQESLATLDSTKDYVLTVTSIEGPKQASQDVTIYSKAHLQPDQSSLNLGASVINAMPELVMALQQFAEEAQFFEADSMLTKSVVQSAVPVRAVCTDHVIGDDEFGQEAESSSSRVYHQAPVYPQPDPTSVLTKPQPQHLVLQRPLILPQEIRYRWQSGFRRPASLCTQYLRVLILRIELDYNPESYELLPSQMRLSLMPECSCCRPGGGDDACNMAANVQWARLCLNKRYVAEFAFFHPFKADSCRASLRILVKEQGTPGKLNTALLPQFSVSLRSQSELNTWTLAAPELLANAF